MYKDNRIAVIIPAYNEEKLIGDVVGSIPEYVDYIIVVDDASKDNTYKSAKSNPNKKVVAIQHKKNQGVGGAIVTGHTKAIELDANLVAVMAGDGQMDPKYLPRLLDAIIDEGYDYAKGNRFLGRDSLRGMPMFRVLGNTILTFLNKLASGYWNIFDPQNGYTAIKTSVLQQLDLDRISKRYEFENDMLVQLNIRNFRVKDVSISALYGEEKSKIKLHTFIPRTSLFLLKSFIRRITEKYVLRDFHPIALLLVSGGLLFMWGIAFGGYNWYIHFGGAATPTGTIMLAVLPLLIGFQLLLAAFVLDIIETPK